MEKRKAGNWLMAASVALAGVSMLGYTSQADAAVTVDVRVVSAQLSTGAAVSVTDNKAVTIDENGYVTVGFYISGLSTSTNIGLASFTGSFRSYNEKYGVATNGTGGTLLSLPSPTTTVVNGDSFAISGTLPSGFDSPVPTLATVKQDINASISNPDPNDTDLDLWKITMSQTGGHGYTQGVGMSGDTLLFTGTFKALDLLDSSYALNRTVNINAYFTSTGAINGGAGLNGLTATNGLTAQLITSASQIGTPVLVTVAPSGVPLPAAAYTGLAGLGLAGLAIRRRARA